MKKSENEKKKTADTFSIGGMLSPDEISMVYDPRIDRIITAFPESIENFMNSVKLRLSEKHEYLHKPPKEGIKKVIEIYEDYRGNEIKVEYKPIRSSMSYDPTILQGVTVRVYVPSISINPYLKIRNKHGNYSVLNVAELVNSYRNNVAGAVNKNMFMTSLNETLRDNLYIPPYSV